MRIAGRLALFALGCSLVAHLLLLLVTPRLPAPVPSAGPRASLEPDRGRARWPGDRLPALEQSRVVAPAGDPGDPVEADTPPADHNETADEEDFKEAKGRNDANSDAQMHGKFNNEAIGVGGGAAGRLGGTYGGRMNLARRGGGGGMPRVIAARPARPAPTTWQRSTLAPHSTRLMIGDDESLPLEGMQVQVRIDGFRARVLIDYYFRNDRDGTYEGSFQLRLPDEASPYFLAFGRTVARRLDGQFLAAAQAADLEPERAMARRADTWGAPKVARIVPRRTAAHAYRETVRRRVDPALMEWTGAGVFRARVFPLAPRALHRVVIGYDLDLPRAGADLQYRLSLPEGLKRSSVDLDLALLPGSTAIVAPAVRPMAASGRLYYRWQNPRGRTISLRVKRAGTTLLVGDGYLATRFKLALPAAPTSGSGRAVFLLDTSLSGKPAQFNVWLALLEAILERNRIEQFAVLCFNVEARWWRPRFSTNTPEAVRSLLAFARTLPLEGATDLGAGLTEAVRPAWLQREARCDFFLLSDGAVTWGERQAEALAGLLAGGRLRGPLFAYRSGLDGADTRLLAQLTAAGGGALFSVTGPAEVARAATAHRSRPWSLARISLAGAHDLLLAGRPRQLYPGQTLVLVGRGSPARDAPVRLTVSQGKHQRTIELRPDHRLDSGLARRAYGELAVAQLEDASLEHRLAQAYARHFRVARRSCSLLMLESEWDYARFGIHPEQDARDVASSTIRSLLPAGRPAASRQRRFLDWVAGLQHVKLDPVLASALRRLPAERIRVPAERLRCRRASNKPRVGSDVRKTAVARFMQLDAADALQAFSSLVERAPGDLQLLREAAYRALAWGLPGQAYRLLRRTIRRRPREPAGYWLAARCLARLGFAELALVHHEILRGADWGRSPHPVLQVAEPDYRRVLLRLARGAADDPWTAFAAGRLARLSAASPAGLLVSIVWNTDATDIDLHVTEPTGETCYFGWRRTGLGGRLTRDITGGHGPELYRLARVAPGAYKIGLCYYATDRNRSSARTRVLLTIVEGERVRHQMVTLERMGDVQTVATMRIDTGK